MKSKIILTSLLTIFLASSPILMSSCASMTHEKSPASYAQSAATTFKVKEALLRDRTVPSTHISVSTYKDTVTLSGHVYSDAQKERAVEIARRVKGVEFVVDQLTVRG